MEQPTRIRISEKGRIVIPSAMREELGMEVGDMVELRIEDKELRISTLKSRLERAQKRLQKYVKPGVLMSDELIAERREAAKSE